MRVGFGVLLFVLAAAPQSTPPLRPVFDCAYENFAWGRVVTGRVVDRDGTVFSYRVRGGPSVRAPAAENGRWYIAEADLLPRFETRERVDQVAREDMDSRMAQLAKAAAGTVTHEDAGMRDAGTHVCLGYISDSARHRLEVVTLGSYATFNDTRVVNSAPEARSLLAWLAAAGVAK